MKTCINLLLGLCCSLLLLSFSTQLAITAPHQSIQTKYGIKKTIIKPTVILTEYYDYECPHCRRMAALIQALQENHPNLKVIDQVTPVLNARSRLIASFALAAKVQGKWQAVHDKLMQLTSVPSIHDVNYLINTLKLNRTAILKTMSDTAIQQALNRNIKQATQYSIQGALRLPIFVFTSTDEKLQPIVLVGEQPYPLLSAVVQQLGEADAQAISTQTNDDR